MSNEAKATKEPELKSVLNKINSRIYDLIIVKNSIYERIGYMDLKNEPQDKAVEKKAPQCLTEELQNIYHNIAEINSEFEKINGRLIDLLG